MPTKVRIGIVSILGLFAAFQIGLDSINPDQETFYKAKRFEERVILSLMPTTDAKAEYRGTLLNKRLQELVNIGSGQKYDYFVPASQRYDTTAGELTQLIVTNNLKGRAKPTQEEFTKHKVVIKYLLEHHVSDKFPNLWAMVGGTLDYLDLYSTELDKLK